MVLQHIYNLNYGVWKNVSPCKLCRAAPCRRKKHNHKDTFSYSYPTDFLMSVTCLCLLKVLNVFNKSMNVDFVDNENKNRCFSPAGLVRAVYKHSLH